jgi:methyl-accepting chemotaxis protein
MFSIGNMKIGGKILSLVFMLLFLSLASSGYGLWKLVLVGEEIKEIGEEDMPMIALVADLETHQLKQLIELERALRYGSNVKQSAREKENLEGAIAAFVKLTRTIDEEFKKAEALAETGVKKAHTEAARKEFEQLRQTLLAADKEYREFIAHVQPVFAALRKGNAEEGVQLGEKAEKEGMQVGEALDKILKAVEKFSEDSMRTALNDEKAAIVGMSIVALASLVIGLLVGVLISRSITRPLQEAVKIAQAVAAGDLTSRIEVTSRDETGQLMQAMKDMGDSLTRVVGEVRGSADALSSASEEVSATAQSMSQGASELRSRKTARTPRSPTAWRYRPPGRRRTAARPWNRPWRR